MGKEAEAKAEEERLQKEAEEKERAEAEAKAKAEEEERLRKEAEEKERAEAEAKAKAAEEERLQKEAEEKEQAEAEAKAEEEARQEAEAQVEDEQLQKESGEAELSQDQIDAATRELMEASEEPIGKPLRAQFTSLPRVASMIDLQGECDKSRVGSLRVKSMKPSSSRHNIPTAPPVREKPARPSVQGMFPSGFNPLAGLASLNKTGGAKSGNGDNSVSAPRLSGGFQMPKFDPS